MKKIAGTFIIAVIVALAAFAGTSTSTGTSSRFNPYYVYFTNNVQGDITIEATWIPKKNISYSLYLLNILPDGAGDVIEVMAYGKPDGDYVCTLPSAPPGVYAAEFIAIAGPTPVTVTVTTP